VPPPQGQHAAMPALRQGQKQPAVMRRGLPHRTARTQPRSAAPAIAGKSEAMRRHKPTQAARGGRFCFGRGKGFALYAASRALEARFAPPALTFPKCSSIT
jgi:hypothetical protein